MPAPARNFARRGSQQKAFTKANAQEKVLAAIQSGLKVADAMALVGRTPETYRDWQKNDVEFKEALRSIREVRAENPDVREPLPDFETFCRDYLGQPLHIHQLRMLDVIEGREPRDLHTSMRYMKGSDWEPAPGQTVSGRVIGNQPPGFAKTTTFSINWLTYQIHKNPNIKSIVVCKDQELAKQILGAIKFRLTSPVYRQMHLKFAPEGGWKDPDSSWNQTAIYVQGKGDGEKDPTVQALGIGGRIYGARSDIIILDDSVTLANVNEHAKQNHWLDQEVESRLDGAGMLLLLGTRVAPTDLYSVMRESEDADDNRVYTYFSQPAVIDEADGNPDNWVSLWPEHMPAKRLRKLRRNEATWALVYQQQDVAEDATFNAFAIAASINSQRFPGALVGTAMGHRPEGMSGLYIVGGLDPATVGYTAMMVVALDRLTGKRYVLDGFNQRTSPAGLRSAVQRLTEQYGIQEWVIERNAFQRFLTQDPELNAFLRARGCRLTEHYTTENKVDPDFGIMAMSPLFDSCGSPPSNGGGGAWMKTPDTALIELPNPRQNAWIAELINQLVVWQPSGMAQNAKTDLVMALWFCNLACIRLLGHGQKRSTHQNNPFATRQRLKERHVVNIAELRAMQLAEREAV